jgi:RNA polymerase-binding transcription factor DksA
MSADLAIDLPRARPGAGPGADAPHLAAEALPRWRTLLELHWRARLERITELSLAYHDAEEAVARAGQQRAHAGRPGAGARAAEEGTRSGRPSRRLLHQAVAERRELAEIEAALSRLTSGGFGRCEHCHGPVSAARLTRIPQARYCTACDH